MRVFVAIFLPKEAREEIEKIQNMLPEFTGKKTSPENIHLTLKFLGEINNSQVEDVKNKLRNVTFNRFKTEVDSMGVFSKNFIRIIWLHLKGPEKLQKEIDKKLPEIFEKEKRFMSHITIARVKNIKKKKKFLEDLKKIKIPKIGFNVDKFFLMESQLSKDGPIYKIIRVFKNEKENIK